MKLEILADGGSISGIAEKIYEGYAVDVNCGSTKDVKWIDHLVSMMHDDMRLKGKKIKIIPIIPSPDNEKLVRFTGEVNNNKDALSFLNKQL